MNKVLEERVKEFLRKSKAIHNDFYDYSKMVYTNAKTPVKIICPEHGEFEQRPENHVRGVGCPDCKGGTKISKSHFIKKAKERHGNRYDYSQVIYKNNHTPVKIICPEHGVFEQKPSDHYKHRCPSCGEEVRASKKTLSQEEFIKKANDVHSNFFDYSKSVYKGHRNKVIITCPKHGDFEQMSNSHLSGRGCPKCKESTGERKIRLFLESHNIEYQTEKTFKECRNIQPLRFDFFIPSKNLCIEYDGVFHFEETKNGFYSNQMLLETQKRDQIKTDFCNGKNGRPKLIRITYKEDVKDRMNQIIETFFS